MSRGNAIRRAALRAIAGAVIVMATLAAPAGAAAPPASDIPPIVGPWQSGGAVIKVTGAGAYTGTIVSGHVGSSCPQNSPPGYAIWRNITGSGFGYKGTVPFVQTDNCASVGEGPATFVLTSINSGSWTATSPVDGGQFTQSITRIGKWPGAGQGDDKPKTNCKKNGKPALCPAQKAVQSKVSNLAAKVAKLGDQLKKANKDGKVGKAIELAAKMDNKVGAAAKKVNKIAKTGEDVLTIKKIWDFLHLPKKEQGPAAKQIAGNQAKEYLFGKEADKTLAVNNALLQTADSKYGSDPAVAAELDTAANYALTGVHYNQLSPSDRLKAAAQIEGTLGTQFNFTNQAANLGIAGLKFTLTTKGVKF